MMQNQSIVKNINASLPQRTIRSELLHWWEVIKGNEKVEKDSDGNRIFTVTEVGKSRAMAKEKAMQKEADAKAASNTKEVSAPITRPIRVRLFRGLRISILLPIALLVIRELVPGVAESLPHVYEFLDSVIVPILVIEF